MRLIDADKITGFGLIIAISEATGNLLRGHAKGKEEVIRRAVDVFIRVLGQVPTIATTVESMSETRGKLAYWKKFRSQCDPPQPEHIKCSNCGQYWAISEHSKTFKYCFNCGAKMKRRAE